MSRLLASILAFSALLLGAPRLGATPACVADCDKLVEKGELASNVSHEGCYVRVCQREARQLYDKAKYQEALESLDYVQDKLDDSPSYLMDRGLTLYALDRFEEALESFERVQRGFPRNVRAGAQRAHTLIRLGRLDDARAQFQALLEQPETEGEFRKLSIHSYLQGNIGTIKLIQGDVAGGKASLLKAFESDKRNTLAVTYINHVIPFMEIGALDAQGVNELMVAYEEMSLQHLIPAAQKLQTLLNRQPAYAPGYQRLAEILRSYQRYEDCEKALRVGESHLPQSVNLRAERLRCTLLRLGANSDAAAPAVRELKELAKAHPENDRVRNVLAAVGYE